MHIITILQYYNIKLLNIMHNSRKQGDKGYSHDP